MFQFSVIFRENKCSVSTIKDLLIVVVVNFKMDLIGLVSKATRHFFDAGTISVDNWTFKMYYKLTIVVVIVMTTMVTSRQFFGHPIYCDAGSVSI